MLIASRFKRPLAPIDFGDQVYFFKPVDPSNPDSAHVCDVKDTGHIGRLLGITEGYYVPEDHEVANARPVASKPVPRAAATVETPPATVKPAETTPPAAVELSALPEEQADAAKNLSELSWQKLKAVLKEGGIAGAVIHEALRIEQAKPEEDQRSTNIKVLSQALETL